MSTPNLDIRSIVIKAISDEIQSILDADPVTYGDFSVIITNERQFIPTKEGKKPKSIFLVIKFLDGSKDLAQQRQSFSINAMSEYNTLDVCQRLLMDFAETYNLTFDFSGTDGETDYTLKEVVNQPVSVSNFNEFFDGYRATFYLTGTFFIGINSNPIKSIVISNNDGLNEEINFITAQLSYDAQLDSQPFFGTNNFNRTVAKIGGLSIGFTTYTLTSDFFMGAFDTIFNDTTQNVDINKTYNLAVTFKGNDKTYNIPMKLASVNSVQELKDFPVISFTFVR